jgi:Ca2+-binding RTX toxin-like protein
MTRSGYINAYETDAPACSPASWPRFHHDNANSGDFERDAVLPGKPGAIAIGDGSVSFDAPGDDLLCGTADHYEIVTSEDPVDESNFDAATPLAGAPSPAAPGTPESVSTEGAARYLAVRAVDEQGNVGRVASVDLQAGGGGEPNPNPPAAGPCANVIAGTPGADKLNGTGGGDKISGKGGPDKIKGGPGDDCLRGGRGRDKLSGGKGNDTIKVRRGRTDRVNCGPGDDTVVASAADHVSHNCEKVKD